MKFHSNAKVVLSLVFALILCVSFLPAANAGSGDITGEWDPCTTHSAGEPVQENYVAASCTVAGGYDEVVYCTICGEVISNTHQTIPATGHTAGDAANENVVAASCTVAGGYDVVVRCTICGEIISSSHETVPATGHTWGEWIIDTEATTTTPGSKHRVCSVCSEQEVESIPVLDPPSIRYGDVDGNGKVNALDRARLARYVAKWEGYDATSVDLDAADVDNNGKVNALDRATLARYVAKWEGYETLPRVKS